jgi:hypothetical protein
MYLGRADMLCPPVVCWFVPASGPLSGKKKKMMPPSACAQA